MANELPHLTPEQFKKVLDECDAIIAKHQKLFEEGKEVTICIDMSVKLPSPGSGIFELVKHYLTRTAGLKDDELLPILLEVGLNFYWMQLQPLLAANAEEGGPAAEPSDNAMRRLDLPGNPTLN